MSVSTIEELKNKTLARADAQNITASFTSMSGFELAQRAAKLLASSSLVPKEFQGNVANCAVALNMAQRLGADPLMVMQNLYIVHGRPGWSSQFLIATFNTAGKFSALRFEFFGEEGTDNWGARAWAKEKATGERLTGAKVTIGLAKSEGWYQRSGSKWQTMPQQMLMYRAASWFVRAYAPELAMGLQSAEELGDTYDATPDAHGRYTVEANRPRQNGARERHGILVDGAARERGEQGQGESASEPEQQPEPDAQGEDSDTGQAPYSPAQLLADIGEAKSIEGVNQLLDVGNSVAGIEQKQLQAAAKARIEQLNKPSSGPTRDDYTLE